jgi:molybdate transport system substrate-binding protein
MEAFQMRKPILSRLVFALLLAVAATAGSQVRAQDLTVFAAASLKNALDDVNAAWAAQGGKPARTSYAASSALARQIESGAPADVFFSADLDWMDYLAQRNLIRPDTRSALLGNKIVLVAPKDSAAKATVGSGLDLAALLGSGGRLATANVDSVPAGKYGKAALEKLGLWGPVKDRLAQAENVRAALLLVSRGEAPLGIVYETDAASDPSVRIVAAFPEDSHPPIVYPVAATATSKNPDVGAYLKFLRSPAAAAAFQKQGFTFLD